MTQTVLIAGASGRIGRHTREAFQAAGWEVRIFDRGNQTLSEAARGVDVIVNGLNPPNYENWETAIPQITNDVIAAAKATGATVIIPGNVYNFGTQMAPWSDETPQIATSIKGQIRVEMEAAYRASGIKVIILRAGDFIDTEASGGFFDMVLTRDLGKGKFTYPGDMTIPHAWAFLPDYARAAVGLAERRDSLETYCDVAFPGFTLSGDELHAELEALLGKSLKTGRTPWWAMKIASPFWKLGKELLEMRYLWDHPHSLDGMRLAELLPDYRDTGLAEALAVAVAQEKGLLASAA